jgi:general stress protein 26
MYKLLLTLSAFWAVHAYCANPMDLINNPSNDPLLEYNKFAEFFDKQNSKNISILSTVDENLQPSQRYILTEKMEDKKISFYIWKNSSASQNIQKNPKVSLIHLIENDDGWIQVELKGKAQLVVEGKKNKDHDHYSIEDEVYKFSFTIPNDEDDSFKNYILLYTKQNGNWKFTKDVYSIPHKILNNEDD